MNARSSSLLPPLLLAAVLWVIIFAWQPLNFWVLMGSSVALLGVLAPRARPHMLGGTPTAADLVVGVALAALLYGVFWVGHRVAAAILPFAPEQINAIYGLREWGDPLTVALLLLLVIGPGEEIFWRGLIQHRLMERLGAHRGWLAAASGVYALVHMVTLNPMLVVAALTAGLAWGYAYVGVRRLWPMIISHALWDVAILIIWPTH